MSPICQIYARSHVHEVSQDCGMPYEYLRKRFSSNAVF